MYRILIVDDEEIIVNGLYDLFTNYDSLELDVYKAYSGEEAMQWLARTSVNIVLTDINMPEYDGLQLLDEIKKRWPWCRVIFLTGHSEFNYAYKAIQYGGVRYLLKTEGYNKIIETVESLIQEFEDENQTNQLIQSAKDQITLAQDLFCQKYFYALLNRDTSLKISAQEFERLFIHLRADEPVILVLGEILLLPEQIDFWKKNQIIYSIKQLIVKHISVNLDCLVVPLRDDQIAIFIQPRKQCNHLGDNHHDLSIFVKGALEVVQSAARDKLDTLVNFVLAAQPCPWSSVEEKYVDLIELLTYYMGQTVETIIDEGAFRKQGENAMPSKAPTAQSILQGLLYRNDLNNFYHLVEIGKKHEYMDAIQKWLKPLETIQNKADGIAIEVYQTLITFLMSCINRMQISSQFSQMIDLSTLHNSDQFATWKDATAHLLMLTDKLFEMKKNEQNKRTNDIIEFVQEYIEANLCDDLSLTTLSEKAYLNASYLSRIYHQTTGHKLSSFIEAAKIKKAKELLQNPNEKIYEIAGAVGYDTAASFTRLFKKAEGISPQEYRDASILQKRKASNYLEK